MSPMKRYNFNMQRECTRRNHLELDEKRILYQAARIEFAKMCHLELGEKRSL